jgi:hypothetical protein
MQGPDKRLAALALWLMLAASPLSGGEPLRMQLFPAVAREPAVLTVRVTVEAADENRVLQVVAESPTFYRSSEVQVDGKRSAPLNVFEFRNVPTGVYHVTSVLIGSHGQRATAFRVARVEPAVGSRR